MEDRYFKGWAEQFRLAGRGKLAFIDLYQGGDPSNKIQVVISGTKTEIKDLGLSRHCALKVRGTVVKSQGKGQQEEVQTTPDRVEVVGRCDPDDYPIAKKDLSLNYLRQIPMWRGRTNLFRAVFGIRDTLIKSIHDYFSGLKYTYIHTPLITKSDCEGAGEAFKLRINDCPDFFGSRGEEKERKNIEGYLTVSGQLQAEVLAAALGPVYTLGPTFRAEKSSTTRHLSEFLMMEPEVPFAELKDIIQISVEMLKQVVTACLYSSYLNVLEKHTPGLKQKLVKFIQEEPVVMTYTEAIDKLENSGIEFEEKVEWGIDLGSEHETWLCGDRMTIITDYPKEIKAFYMYQNPDDKTVACMDLLLPGIGEVIGGSQRESRLEIMEPKMEKLGLGGEEYDFYRDLRRFGYSGSSGFGLGVERLVRFVTGMTNIRDVIPFPVAYGKIHC